VVSSARPMILDSRSKGCSKSTSVDVSSLALVVLSNLDQHRTPFVTRSDFAQVFHSRSLGHLMAPGSTRSQKLLAKWFLDMGQDDQPCLHGN